MKTHTKSIAPLQDMFPSLSRISVKFGACILPLASIVILVYLFTQDNNLIAGSIPIEPRVDSAHKESGHEVQPDITESLFQLFGTTQNQSPESEASEAPLTPLNLTLKGAFTHSQQERSYALIESDGKASVYKVGDEILAGVKLVSVKTGQVVIRRNGRDEQLVIGILGQQSGSGTANEATSTLAATSPAPTTEALALKQEDLRQASVPVTVPDKSLSVRLKELRERQSAPH